MKLAFFNQIVALAIAIFGVINLSQQTAYSSTYPSDNSSQNSLQINPVVAEIARQITVRIFTNPGSGSGVIIQRQGQTYTVLTCAHVVNIRQDKNYKVLTPDGKVHIAVRQKLVKLQGIDLAVIHFQSKIPYQVAVLGNLPSISIGEPIYIAGFPNYYQKDSNSLEFTDDWGIKGFHLTIGKLSILLSNNSLHKGYQIGYTNLTKGGMSGGAVLDSQGKLIGIHGRGRPTIQGKNTLRFTDGTMPSSEMYQQMSNLSWAIPILSFQQRMGQLLTEPKIRNNLTVPLPEQIKKPAIAPHKRQRI